MVLVSALGFACLISCKSEVKEATHDQKLNIEPTLPEFDPGTQYSRLESALESGELAKLQQIVLTPFKLDGVELDQNELDRYFAQLLILSKQTKTYVFTAISCEKDSTGMTCNLMQSRKSTYQRTPNSQSAEATSKRKDSWIWDGKGWRLQGTHISDTMISN